MSQPSLLKDSLDKYKQTLDQRQKYVKKDYQAYGLELAKELHDWKNRSLYIRLAKEKGIDVIEPIRRFVKDQTPHTVKSPKKLFMWKLGQPVSKSDKS